MAAGVAVWSLQEDGWEEASKHLDLLSWLVAGVLGEAEQPLEVLNLKLGAAQTNQQRH